MNRTIYVLGLSGLLGSGLLLVGLIYLLVSP